MFSCIDYNIFYSEVVPWNHLLIFTSSVCELASGDKELSTVGVTVSLIAMILAVRELPLPLSVVSTDPDSEF